MLFTSSVVILAIATIAAAAPSRTVEERSPAPDAVEPRWPCQTIWPEASYNHNWIARWYDPDYEATDVITFHVPDGATGACDLKLSLPDGNQLLVGNTQVDFRYGTGVGTTYTFSHGPVDRYVGSFGCAQDMTFTMAISPEQGKQGYVGFSQYEGYGLYMTHSC